MAIDIFKKEKREQLIFLIIFFVLLIIFFVLLDYIFIRSFPRSTGKIAPQVYQKVKIDFSLFDNQKFKKINSPSFPEVKEEKPGRENPFVPFE